MAQATISGVLDVAAFGSSKTTTVNTSDATETSKTSSASGVSGAWATSELRIGGSEDLGGGLTASFQLNSDLRGATPGFVTRDRWLQVAGGFGSVRVGSFVPAAAAGFHGFSGARTTGTAGNIYGLSTAAPTSNAILHAGTFVSFERQGNVIQYSSPNFNGITVNLALAKDSADRSDSDRAGKNEKTQTSLHIAYAAGPLSVGVGMNNAKSKREAAPQGTTADSTIVATGPLNIFSKAVDRRELKSDLDWIGASYNLGVATVSAAHVKRKDKNDLDGATIADVKVNSIGVSVPMGAITLGANTFSGKDNRATGNTDDMKLKGYQLSATYALSKRTTIYFVTGEAKSQRNSAANTGEQTVKTTATNIGLAHSF
jgi:predicted porin